MHDIPRLRCSFGTTTTEATPWDALYAHIHRCSVAIYFMTGTAGSVVYVGDCCLRWGLLLLRYRCDEPAPRVLPNVRVRTFPGETSPNVNERNSIIDVL
jgi:hypothetical protein